MDTETAHKAPNYYLIWLILFVLTLAEVGVAFLTMVPKQILILVLLAMAVWKAMLVAMYYMHLKFEPRKLWIMVAAPLPLAVILVVIVLSERW
ncbi:MAG: cytochrome C oxidase subunit IV family protein [Gemmatimonadota bacterium]